MTVSTLDEFAERFGGIPLERIRTTPPPGTATVDDLLEEQGKTDVTLELVDGTLVEKAMGSWESLIHGHLLRILGEFADEHDLGLVFPGDGQLRITFDLVRAPDVSFVSWDQFPNRELPEDAIWLVHPDLAVEVRSRSNKQAELDRKRKEYFDAGARLVWQIEPAKRTATIHHPDGSREEIDETGTLSGEDVLPRFELSLGELFRRAERR